MDKSKLSLIAKIIALSTLIGGAAGVLTTALTTNYLSEYAMQLGELTEPLRLSEERPRQLPESYAESVKETREKLLPSLVSFFVPKRGVGNFYELSDKLMNGIILTSDGWLVTKTPIGIDASLLVVGIGQDIFPVEQVVRDEITGLVFVKINAGNLPVVAFGDGYSVELGEQLFAAPQEHSLLGVQVQEVDRGKAERNSGIPVRRLILDNQEIALGSPVANLAGELIGLVDSTQKKGAQVIPINSILPSFTMLLREGKIFRPKLNLKFIDLARAIGISPEFTRGFKQGAFLPGPQRKPFESGDIIVSVNSQPINERLSFDELLLNYQIGDKITLSVDRKGERLELEIEL